MSYFLRSGYGYLKGGVGIVGLISGVGGAVLGGITLAGGSTVVGAIIITVGGMGIITSAFSLNDVKGWLEMKKAIDQLEEVRKKYEQLLTEFAEERVAIGEERKKFGAENEKLAENADRFEITSENLEQENIKLKETVAQYHIQLQKIQRLACERDEEMKKITKEREELTTITEEQRANLLKAFENNEQYAIEIATHKEIRKRLEEQITHIELLSKDYEEQNITFRTTIEKDKERIANGEKMIASLESQLAKFKLMYDSMKQLVNVITETESEMKTILEEDIQQLNDTVDNIDTAVDNMIKATDKMTNAYKHRTINDFERFDLDHDGKLSQYEFLKAMGVNVQTDPNGNVIVKSIHSTEGTEGTEGNGGDIIIDLTEEKDSQISTSPDTDSDSDITDRFL